MKKLMLLVAVVVMGLVVTKSIEHDFTFFDESNPEMQYIDVEF